MCFESSMVSTPEGLLGNIPMAMCTLDTMKNPSAIRSISQFLALLDVTQKTAVRIIVSAKTKQKSSQTGIYLW